MHATRLSFLHGDLTGHRTSCFGCKLFLYVLIAPTHTPFSFEAVSASFNSVCLHLVMADEGLELIASIAACSTPDWSDYKSFYWVLFPEHFF